MARIDLKFLCVSEDGSWIKTFLDDKSESGESFIRVELKFGMTTNVILLDKSTAIRFAKTLRTEINKIQ